jgi:dipeptidyl aminopeptidase/acylaminoacyl peptidase
MARLLDPRYNTRVIHRIRRNYVTWLFALLLTGSKFAKAAENNLGLFEAHRDIGSASKPGSVSFDSTNLTYTIAGAGANMWFTNDAFHFVWKRLSGDVAMKAGIEWIGAGGNAHRKSCLMIRQSLDDDSPYADVAVHGNGLISLQYREQPGGQTREIQVQQPSTTAVSRLPIWAGIERQGKAFFVSLVSGDEAPDHAPTLPRSNAPRLSPTGASIQLEFTDPVYVGHGVCAHDDSVLESARFTGVTLEQKHPPATARPILHCALEIVPIGSKDRRVIYHTTNHIEAPNWSRDGKFFVFNAGGHIYRLPVTGGKPELLDTGFATRCNNDHGFSPDGTRLAISDQSRDGKSRIYTLPITGGMPEEVTKTGPSYWHGWSPDGLTLAYCAEREGEFDIYTIPAGGGEEKRLTTAKGLDDGPDFSPDGKFIYFNSDRSGSMQIWRMKSDGTQQEQITSDEFNNWFPHPSPDGKWLVFLSYEKNVTGHPANQPVKLRLMPLNGGPIQDLARLFGGQGTINVPSWSPDSKEVAFVSYELIY